MTWGRRSTLRVASDGDHVAVRLDGQPVLYRRVRDLYPWASPLSISRVGLAVNREWGDDTGTDVLRLPGPPPELSADRRLTPLDSIAVGRTCAVRPGDA